MRAYVLAPGERVKSDFRRRARRFIRGFRVYVPDETQAQFIEHPTIGCANSNVHLPSQRPYRLP